MSKPLFAGLALAIAPLLALAVAPNPALSGLPAPVVDEAATVAPARSWQQLSPAQQHQARQRYAAWQALDEDSRTRIRHAASALAQLPAERRQELQIRFQALDRMVRDGWWLGPRLGAVFPKLQPLLGFVEAQQREALLALLRQLDEHQLGQLVLISQRTPPQERAALRQELLQLPAAERGPWLARKVNR